MSEKRQIENRQIFVVPIVPPSGEPYSVDHLEFFSESDARYSKLTEEQALAIIKGLQNHINSLHVGNDTESPPTDQSPPIQTTY